MDFSPKSPRRLHVDGREYHMPDMRFHYNADTLYPMLEAAGAENLPRLRRYWRLDFGFIVCFLGVMLSIDFNIDGPATTLYVVMGVAAVLRALLDALENLLFLRIARAMPARRPRLANVAGFVTSAKFLCLYAWVAMLFLKLFARAFGLPWQL
jgi:hypothetical protein